MNMKVRLSIGLLAMIAASTGCPHTYDHGPARPRLMRASRLNKK